jgi:hypothetical protein
MPIDPNLNISITPAQKAAIEAILTNALNEIKNVIVDPLNLSEKERQRTPSINVQREGYVKDAIENLSGQFTNMLSEEITTARARNLWEFRNSGTSMLALVDEIRDRLVDAIINAENICLKFTRDMRKKAKAYNARNVHGADVVWNRLKGLEPTRFKLAKEPKPV